MPVKRSFLAQWAGKRLFPFADPSRDRQIPQTGSQVRVQKILEQATPLVRFPTAGATRGTSSAASPRPALAMTNTGKITDPAKLKSVHIASVPLE
jgi:hypothetical protein